ncbi:AraC-like DNA-binding protein [Agrobacterium vitis]|nr:AraC-like DNA-binding protein [Agrobacterium vitis]
MCTPSTSCFQTGASIRGVERLEARFIGSMFSPHRHDTYALGLTLSGIQTFTYRGEQRFSAAGNIIVLHPDELHDGGAGTDAGLTYRMIYLPPELILDASEGYGQPLPFVSTPVIRDHDLATTLYDALKDLSTAPDDIEMDDIQMRLAAGLHRNSGNRNPTASIAIDTLAVRRVAEFLSEHALEAVSSQRLEAISGLDRFALSRHFRRRMGTSPHRFQMMRRLQRARVLLMHHNTSLADAAIATGFADQAHFSRHFKATYGLPPGQWLSLLQSRTASSHIR